MTLQTLLQGRGDSDDLDRPVPNLKVVLIVYINVPLLNCNTGSDLMLHAIAPLVK